MNPRIFLAAMAAMLHTTPDDGPIDEPAPRRELPPPLYTHRNDTIGSYTGRGTYDVKLRGTYDVKLRQFATHADRDAFNAAAQKRERKAAARLARGRA